MIDRCLDCLLAQDHPDFEVLVVDDGSSDATAAIAAQRLAGGPHAVHRGPGRGISAARNAGLARARGEAIAFVDADGYPQPQWLSAACAALAADPSAGAVASLVCFDANPAVVNGAGGTIDVRGHARDICFGESIETAALPREVLYPMGNGMVFRREALEQAGAFDEGLSGGYDDTSAGARLWGAGWRVVLAADAVLGHGYHAGAEGIDRDALHERDRIRFMLAEAPLRSLPRWLAGELAQLLRGGPTGRRLRAAWAANLRAAATLPSRRRGRRRAVPRHLIAAGREQLPSPTLPPRGRHLFGWHAPEAAADRRLQWTADRAALLLELDHAASGTRLSYRLPPASGQGRLELRRPGERAPLAAAPLSGGGWRELELEAALAPGRYEALIEAGDVYVDARRRRLGVAVESLEALR